MYIQLIKYVIAFSFVNTQIQPEIGKPFYKKEILLGKTKYSQHNLSLEIE